MEKHKFKKGDRVRFGPGKNPEAVGTIQRLRGPILAAVHWDDLNDMTETHVSLLDLIAHKGKPTYGLQDR